MFGFKLVKKRKMDEKDLEIFCKSVNGIMNICDSFIQYLTKAVTKKDLDPEKMEIMLQHLFCYSKLYSDNKFSSPIRSFNIDEEISGISNDITDLTNIYIDLFKEDDDCPDVNIMLLEKLAKCMTGILGRLKSIRFTVSYDFLRIGVGMDIIRDYYARNKIRFFKHNCDDTMTIRFVKPSVINKNKGVGSK